MARLSFIGPLVLFAALAQASPARADNASDAKDLFARGRDLSSHGDCAGAVPLFRKAYAVYPAALGSLRNLATCEEALGHVASAHRAWLDLKQALLANKDSKYDGWAADADAAATRLSPKVSYLTVDVSDPDRANPNAIKVVVTVDDEPLPESLYGTPLARDAGTHVVRAQRGWTGADDETTQEERVSLGTGETKQVTMKIAGSGEVAVELPPTASAPLEAPVDAPAPPHDAKRTAAWVALGVGVAGVIGTVVSVVVRQNALSDVETACPSYASAPCGGSAATVTQLHSDTDRGGTASTLVNVFGAVGVVGVASSVVLFAISGHHAATPVPTATSLVLTPGGASLVGRF